MSRLSKNGSTPNRKVSWNNFNNSRVSEHLGITVFNDKRNRDDIVHFAGRIYLSLPIHISVIFSHIVQKVK